MSNIDFQERLARHRGFTTKAREVLLEPPAPFVVATEISGSSSNEPSNPKSPHRGFTAKAREMLVERQANDNHHGLKSIRSDLEKFHKQQSYLTIATSDQPPMQQPSIVYEEKKISIPHSKLSRIKAHKLLGETGKTRSANEIFYDKCMKRMRSPPSHNELLVSSVRTVDDKMIKYATLEGLQVDVSDKEKNAG
uniref:Uncharacterized protein n=1 Tax=Setaria digitata TaxID=48799 RepID=A0A915PBT9_9BILA